MTALDRRPQSAPPARLPRADRDKTGWQWVRCPGGWLAVPALHAAVCSRSLVSVQRVIIHAQAVGGLDETDGKGQTALNIAAAMGFHTAVRAMLRAGCDAEASTSGKGISPLYSAALFGRAPAARLLLAAGVDAHQLTTDEYRATALWAAARGGHSAVVDALLEFSADPDMGSLTAPEDIHRPYTRELGTSPLWVAVAGRHVNCINALLAAGADPNRRGGSDGTTPLFVAAEAGDTDTCRKLLAAGADPNWGNVNGTSPLRVAEVGGWPDTLTLLRRTPSARGSRSCCGPGCFVAEARLKCSQCRFARYCSLGCQRAHWPEHADRCAVMAANARTRVLGSSKIKYPGEEASTLEVLAHARRAPDGTSGHAGPAVPTPLVDTM
eukprot:jgi/Tetstr1/436714/TSEL_025497.t1